MGCIQGGAQPGCCKEGISGQVGPSESIHRGCSGPYAVDIWRKGRRAGPARQDGQRSQQRALLPDSNDVSQLLRLLLLCRGQQCSACSTPPIMASWVTAPLPLLQKTGNVVHVIH